MMWASSVLSVGFAVLTSCGSAPRIPPLYLEPDPALRETVRMVAQRVDEVTGQQVLLLAAGSEPSVIKVRLDKLSGSDCGIWNYAANEAVVNTECNSVLWPTIVTHEIGHALGLGHVDDPKSVMYFRAHVMSVDGAASSLVHELNKQE